MLQIQITGKDIDLTDALKGLITRKFNNLMNHVELQAASVVLCVENREQIIKASLHAQDGSEFNGTGRSEDMYKSIDKLVDILDKQAVDHKEKLLTRKHKKIKTVEE